MAVKSLEWSTLTKNNNIGLVVGATDIPALKRKIVPSSWILCPGVGAQGGDAKVHFFSQLIFIFIECPNNIKIFP